ncbi:MAG TPA: hypothetical protein VIU33_05890 [Nitrospiria bacterium]
MRRFNRYTFLSTVLLGAFLLTFNSPAGAQFSIPDPSRSVQAVAFGADGTLYMGTFGKGVFKSGDRGKTWEWISEGLRDKFIYSLLIVSPPKNRFKGAKELIFAGGARMGIFRTSDGGKTWEQINTGLKNREILRIVPGSRGEIYAATGQGIYLSRDHGDSWTLHHSGLEDVLVRALAVAPDGTLYAGTSGRGLFRLNPGQKRWTQLTRGIGGEEGLRENFIRVLTLGPDGVLYAGTFDGGIYGSWDEGITWKNLNLDLKNHSIRAILIGEGGDLIIATGRGVFTRAVEAFRWRAFHGDLDDLSFQTMIMDKNGFLYGGTGGGLYRGTLSGDWVSLTSRLYSTREGM